MRARRRHPRSSFRSWITNWRESDLPIPLRLAVAARNYGLRVVRRDTCCGHDGEPGC